MGNRFEISVVADEEYRANECIAQAVNEIRRIEKLLTTFDESSQTNLINRNAGIAPVKVDKEVFDLIQRSQKISQITQGSFDITYGSIDKKLWNFVIIDGKKYSHTIDPKTGLPVTGIKSVSIISPNAEIADAMATPVMVMGIKAGLDMINQIKGLACIIIDDNGTIYTSKNIHIK
jgi:thiamine biosynthesis lipoprotein ApbE